MALHWRNGQWEDDRLDRPIAEQYEVAMRRLRNRRESGKVRNDGWMPHHDYQYVNGEWTYIKGSGRYR